MARLRRLHESVLAHACRSCCEVAYESPWLGRLRASFPLGARRDTRSAGLNNLEVLDSELKESGAMFGTFSASPGPGVVIAGRASSRSTISRRYRRNPDSGKAFRGHFSFLKNEETARHNDPTLISRGRILFA